ncbi:hypothetical protein Btru_001966 [Bulinus truncatus]|nr:hypothetical protein Btru_001966 [Bulinus truncatus]
MNPGSRSSTPTHHSSSSMAQALNAHVQSSRPCRTSCRVKDAGREYLEQNETCHWIQYMTEETPDFSDRRERRPRQGGLRKQSPFVYSDSVVDAKESVESPEVESKQEELPEQSTKPVKEDDHESDAGVQPEHEEIIEPDPGDTLRTVAAVSEPQEKTCQGDLIRKPVSEPEITQRTAPSILRGKSRRLKGLLAQTCALRDEGTVGSLLCYHEEMKPPCLNVSPPSMSISDLINTLGNQV